MNIINVSYTSTFLIILLALLSNCGSKQPSQDKPLILAQALKKQTKDMTFQEAAYAKEYYEKEQDTDMMVKSAQRMVAVGGDQELIRKTTLQLAQLFLDKGDFEKAQKYSQDYQTLYPGTAEVKEAGFIHIKSHFLATLEADRDQSKTEKTIELAQNFLTKHKADSEYCKSVKSIMDDCYRKLIDKEVNVINSYLSRYNYSKAPGALLAAHKRLAHIKEKLSPQSTYNESTLKEIEVLLAQAGPIPNIVILKAEDTKPAQAITHMAQAEPKNKAAERF